MPGSSVSRPCNAPEIVVATLFENGEHGQLAAPIVRDVIKAYFDKKARLSQPQPQIASLPRQLLAPPAPLALSCGNQAQSITCQAIAYFAISIG